MTHSPEIDKLAAALVKVQAAIKPATKNAANPFFKSKYADLGEVVGACRDELVKNGFAVVQGADMIDGKPVLVTTLLHTSGQWIAGAFELLPVKADSQAIGSAISYMRRYSLASMVGVVTEDDDGEAAMARGNGHVPSPQTTGAPPPGSSPSESKRQPVPRASLSCPGPQGHPEQWTQWAENKLALPDRELSDWVASDDYTNEMALCKKASAKLYAWIEKHIVERNAA